MRNLSRVSFLLTALLVFGAGRASADTLLSYSFTGANSVSFELPVNPTPTSFDLTIDFEVTPTNLMINGAPSSDTLLFFSSTFGGAFAAISCPSTSCVTFSLAGPQLYSGSEAAPTMLVVNGVTLVNDMGGAPAGTVTSTPMTATPEPSATVLLGVGLLAVGLAVLGFKPKLAVLAR